MGHVIGGSWGGSSMSTCQSLGGSRGGSSMSTCQSPVYENGVYHTEVESEKSTSVYRGRAKIYTGGGARDSRLLPWKHVRKFGDSHENLSYGDSNENLKTCKLWGVQWKLENESPQIFWQVLTEVHGSPAAPPLLYILALPLCTEVDFSLSTSVWRTPFS